MRSFTKSIYYPTTVVVVVGSVVVEGVGTIVDVVVVEVVLDAP